MLDRKPSHCFHIPTMLMTCTPSCFHELVCVAEVCECLYTVALCSEWDGSLQRRKQLSYRSYKDFPFQAVLFELIDFYLNDQILECLPV